MIEIILYTLLLYFMQLFLPVTLKRRMTKEMFQRSRRATENLKESLPAFLALAILSIIFDVQANDVSAFFWLLLRVIFAAIYISGFNLKPVNESGHQAQPLRSFVWALSIVALFDMAINFI
tara:strand:- start:261 stop:623 length:363 start_codon:yes stop_codon:yes gene_type:complete